MISSTFSSLNCNLQRIHEEIMRYTKASDKTIGKLQKLVALGGIIVTLVCNFMVYVIFFLLFLVNSRSTRYVYSSMLKIIIKMLFAQFNCNSIVCQLLYCLFEIIFGMHSGVQSKSKSTLYIDDFLHYSVDHLLINNVILAKKIGPHFLQNFRYPLPHCSLIF